MPSAKASRRHVWPWPSVILRCPAAASRGIVTPSAFAARVRGAHASPWPLVLPVAAEIGLAHRRIAADVRRARRARAAALHQHRERIGGGEDRVHVVLDQHHRVIGGKVAQQRRDAAGLLRCPCRRAARRAPGAARPRRSAWRSRAGAARRGSGARRARRRGRKARRRRAHRRSPPSPRRRSGARSGATGSDAAPARRSGSSPTP